MITHQSRNAAIYYGMQLGILGVPILLIPFYGHVLGAEGLGLISQGQAFTAIIAIIVDYGFYVTAVRDVAGNRDDARALGRILADVLTAKCFLVFVVVVISIPAILLVPHFRSEPLLYFASLAAGIAQGLSLYWFFSGRLHYVTAGCLELAGKVLAAALILSIVRDRGQEWIAQASFAATTGAFFVVSMWMAYRQVPFAQFSAKGARSMLGAGRHTFGLALIGTFYTNANVLLLGAVASPLIVGIFSGAEKIAKLLVVLFAPVRQIFFPVVAAKVADNPPSAWFLVRRLIRISTFASAAGAVLIFTFAEPIVKIVLGPAFLASIPVLQIMAVIPVLIVATECIGTFWLLPNRMDKVMTRIMMIVGAFHVLLFIVLSRSFGVTGSGIAVVASQSLILFLVYWAARIIPGFRESPHRT